MSCTAPPLKFRARALFLSALLALGGAAQAANVLILEDPASDGVDAGLSDAITVNLQAVCFPGAQIATPTDTVTVVTDNVLPASLSGYDQIWDLRFNTALTATEQSAYASYLDSGGRMFLMGENASFPARNASIVSMVSTLGGGTLPTVTGFYTTPQDVQTPYNTTPNAITTVTYLVSGGVATSGTGQWITYDTANSIGSAIAWPTGSLANATAGSLSVVFDVNFMQVGRSGNNPQLLQNLCATVATGGHPAGQIALTLSAPTRAVGQSETVRATVTDGNGDPLADTDVTFTITDGPNKGKTGTVKTNALGVANFTYTGSGGVGTDTIEASVPITGGGTLSSNTLTVVWQVGAPAGASAVPTLGDAALAALGLLLAGAGMGAVWRRRAV